MKAPGILGSFIIVSFGMAVPFLSLPLGWLSPNKQEGSHSLRESLLRLALWLASLSFVLAFASLLRIQEIAPTSPSTPWVALNWVSTACWMLVFLFSLLGKGKARIALLGWSITFPIFAAIPLHECLHLLVLHTVALDVIRAEFNAITV